MRPLRPPAFDALGDGAGRQDLARFLSADLYINSVARSVQRLVTITAVDTEILQR